MQTFSLEFGTIKEEATFSLWMNFSVLLFTISYYHFWGLILVVVYLWVILHVHEGWRRTVLFKKLQDGWYVTHRLLYCFMETRFKKQTEVRDILWNRLLVALQNEVFIVTVNLSVINS